MNWNRELESAARTPTKTCNGTACYFVKLTPTIGLKLYSTPHERDVAYVMQSIGAEHGIAPDVGQCVDLDNMEIPRSDAPSWWGDHFKRQKSKTLYGYLTQVAMTGEVTEYEDADMLYQKAAALGFDAIGDIAPNSENLARLPDGRPVITDWDGRFGVTGLLTPSELEEIDANFSACSLWYRIKPGYGLTSSHFEVY